MRLNKKVIGAVLGITGILAVTAVTTNDALVSDVVQGVSEAANTGLEDEAIAGVTATLYEYQRNAAKQTAKNVSVEKQDIEVVAASLEEEAQADVEAALQGNADDLKAGISAESKEQESDSKNSQEETSDSKNDKSRNDKEKKSETKMTQEEKNWQDYLMADVEQSLNVRKEANEESEIVGKLYKGDRAKIVKAGDTWTKIESGNVKGYVKNEYCVTGTDALKYAKKNCDTVAVVTTDGLRLRSEQSTEGPVITAVAAGTELKVKTGEKTKDGWVAVVYENDMCYVSEDYVELKIKTGKAVTLEEEAAQRAAEEAAKKAAEEAAAKKAAGAGTSSSSSSQKSGAATTQGAAVSASVDDVTLLAAIIQCEAGGCSYEGKLAVGAVVMNRVKSSSFPNTISGVIYQRGQFSPARTGLLASRLARGVSASCRQAAQAAISGQDNTNGAKYFKYASSGQPGVVYGTVVFY